ncbi:MAG: cupin domain-containing protein [Halobaculum sp.]
MDATALPEAAADAESKQAVLHESDPRTVLLSLDAGESVPEHRHPGETILFQVVSGTVDLTVGEDRRELSAGDLARFDGDQAISPHAESDTVALVVLVDE